MWGCHARLVRVLDTNSREMNNDHKVAKNPPSGKRQSGMCAKVERAKNLRSNSCEESAKSRSKNHAASLAEAPLKESRRKPSRSTIEESAKPENDSPAEESTNSHLEA
jgi:hypothetical protein